MSMRLIRPRNSRRHDGAVGNNRRQDRKPPRFRRLNSEILEDRRMLHALTTGTGDGGLTVSVDGYGSFGSAVGSPESGNAIYDPVGPIAAASTTFESYVAIRIGTTGPREFLTSGGASGLPDPVITGSSTHITSSFAMSGLSAQLLQTVAPMIDSSGARTGSLLAQSYLIRNVSSAPIEFELVRYLDGDLLFDGSLVDGGGKLTLSNSQFLFETDAGGTGETSTTFVGIDASGGTIPPANRFDIDAYPLLRGRIADGGQLRGVITGDINGDGFVDSGHEYDVTLGLLNQFNLAVGSSVIYTTRTVFGSGTPGAVDLGIPTASIGPDVSQFEGDSGLTNFVFPITLSQAPLAPVTVVYTTQNGTAVAPSDYLPQSGTLTFLPDGATSQTVTIQVVGDLIAEANETFSVQLTQVNDALAGRSVAVATILNDDVELAINDVTVLEGDIGTTNAIFTVSAIGFVNRPITVNYFTSSDTAIGGSDYLPVNGALSIAPGTSSATIAVPIVGDLLNESTEDFFVHLSSPVNARLDKSVGTGTILDNDPIPFLIVNNVHVTTTQPGEVDAVFAVALNLPSGQDVTVQYFTADGSAKANTDNSTDNDTYSATSGTLDFPAGVTKQLVTVPVQVNGSPEPNETFSLNLTNPFHAKIFYPQGIATIIFADPPPSEFIIDDGEDGYSQTSGWTNTTNTLAYHLDYDYHAPGNGQDAATWTFADIAPITYEVFVRWSWYANRATNAPYTIYDGSTPEATVPVNQQVAPTGDMSDGITWQSIGRFAASSGTLVVKLGANANGYVTADAVRIVAHGIPQQIPEMDVAGFGQSIADGARAPISADATDFGGVPLDTDSAGHTFTIANTGNADLHLVGIPRVSILGPNALDFAVIAQPNAVVAGGANTTFQVVFHPTFQTPALSVRQAIISIDNDDASEHPYTFEVQGTAVDTSLNQNVALPQDVNGDHAVTSIDVLFVINRLDLQNATSISSAATSIAAAAAAPAAGSGMASFCDVNGDGVISPLDALMVINYLLLTSNPPSAVPAAAQSMSSTSNSLAAQTFAAVDQAYGPLGATTATAAGQSAAAGASGPATIPITPPPATIVTLSPVAVRLVFASSAKKPGAQAGSSPDDLGV
jgi:hypothetical protein